MKLATISCAFLGLPSALAGYSQAYESTALIPLDASPTRPEAALVVPAASVLSPTVTNTPQPDADFQRKQDIKRAQIPTVPMSSSGSSSSSSAKGGKHTTTASGSAPRRKHSTTTKIPELQGSFTAGGAVFGVTSESGFVVIDGKTLSVGGPDANIAGEIVTEGSKGLIVDGSTISLSKFSSSSVPPMPTSSSAPAGQSSSSVAGNSGGAAPPSSSPSSSPNAAPAPTAVHGANAAALIGAVVGAMIL